MDSKYKRISNLYKDYLNLIKEINIDNYFHFNIEQLNILIEYYNNLIYIDRRCHKLSLSINKIYLKEFIISYIDYKKKYVDYIESHCKDDINLIQMYNILYKLITELSDVINMNEELLILIKSI